MIGVTAPFINGLGGESEDGCSFLQCERRMRVRNQLWSAKKTRSVVAPRQRGIIEMAGETDHANWTTRCLSLLKGSPEERTEQAYNLFTSVARYAAGDAELDIFK